MGLIRKTLSVATPVRPESKKQRVAREALSVQTAILAELRSATARNADEAPAGAPLPSLEPVTSRGGASWLDAYR